MRLKINEDDVQVPLLQRLVDWDLAGDDMHNELDDMVDVHFL